jgi:hypothetical protein
VRYQLRLYTVKPGAMESWVAEWTAHVLPLRRTFGFDVIGPWIADEENLFVWILGFGGEGGWEVADAAYYDSQERSSLSPDPARHLAKTEQWMMRKVPRS